MEEMGPNIDRDLFDSHMGGMLHRLIQVSFSLSVSHSRANKLDF